MKFNEDVSINDRILILFRTGIKILRGFWVKLFLGKSEGLLFVGRNVSIIHKKHIKIGKNVKFEDNAEIHGLCSDGILLGSHVTIGRGVMIRPSSYYGIDYGKGIEIGDNSSIGPNSYIGCSGKIKIGKNVMIGPRCSLFAENHNFNNSSVVIKEQGVTQKGIVIEDDCWIASNCIILDGVTIGTGSVIGAGTLVTKNIPPRSVVVDSRDKLVKER